MRLFLSGIVVLFLVLFFLREEKGPSALYLSLVNDPTTTMTIQWHSEKRDEPVFFQKQGETHWTQQANHPHLLKDGTFLWGEMFVHTVELTALEPGTDYTFRLGESAETYRFRTLSQDKAHPLHFVVGGDVYQDDLRLFKRMNAQVAKLDPDFVVLGGDIAYTRGHGALLKGRYFEIKRWQTFFKAWKEQMVTSDGRLIPLVVVIGNHDLESTHPDPRKKPVLFYEFFAMKEPLFAYRTLDFPSLSLILLDTGHTYPIAGAQTAWLEKALQERKDVMQKLAVYHVSAYPSVYDYGKGNRRHIRQSWVPLFELYRVNAAFEHHDHAYKRTFRIKENTIDPTGVLYLGDGGWGATTRTPLKPEELWYLAKTDQRNFVYLVSLSQESGVVQAISSDGECFDTVSLAH